MYSMNDSAIADVVNSAYRIASENLSFKYFIEQSKAGNSFKIIEIIRGIPGLNNITVEECFLSKSNEVAKICLMEAERSDKTEIKLYHLTKALFAAEIRSNDKTIFYDILVRRIRCSFDCKHLKKCLKDCRYMISLLDNVDYADLENTKHREYRIECLSYESRCLKILGDVDEARGVARNGIKEVKNLFQKIEERGETIDDAKKLETLRPFLNVLNNGQQQDEAGKINATKIETLPRVLGKRNNVLKSCSDAVVARYDETKGRHLVATRNIKPGSVLIVDRPFAWSTNKEMIENNCLHCHASLKSIDDIQIPCHNCQTVRFCSEDCRIESWEKYHRWECSIFDYFYQMQKNQSSRLLLAYRTTISLIKETGKHVTEDNNQPFSELRNYYCNNDNVARKIEILSNETYDPFDYRTVYSLQTNQKSIEPKVNLMHAIHGVVLAKCFRFTWNKIKPDMDVGDEEEIILSVAMLRHLQAINSNAYEIVENVLNNLTKVWEPRTVGGAIYPTVSLTNHSCFPNVVRHTYPKGKVVVRAIRSIQKGAEILDCYGPHFLQQAKTARQSYLLKKYNFRCLCEACDNNLVAPDSSGLYKCKNCSSILDKLAKFCGKCGKKIDRVKIDKIVKHSFEQRSIAIQKMLDGDHVAALPILLNHFETVEKIFSEHSLEAIKTQQALIQCFNSAGCVGQ